MRVTSMLGLAGLVVIGIMWADTLKNPTGTKAAAGGIVSIMTPAIGGLLGQAPKGG